MFFYLFFSTHSFANLCASVIWSGVIFRFPPLFGKHYGLDTEWYENGVKMIEKHYKNGVKDGRGTEWSKDGEKINEKDFKGGKEQ